MKTHWKHIIHVGAFMMTFPALVVATQSVTDKEVHPVASVSQTANISYENKLGNHDEKEEMLKKQVYAPKTAYATQPVREEIVIKKEVPRVSRDLSTSSNVTVQNSENTPKSSMKSEAVKQDTKPQVQSKPKTENAVSKTVNSKPQIKTQTKPQHTPQTKPQQKPVIKPQIKPQQKIVKKVQPQTKPQAVAKVQTSIKNSTSTFYVKGIPMPYEHQKYLYELTKKRGLNYYETLAFIGHESKYNPGARGGESYGYFQVHKVNHSGMAKLLGTKNAPFDPYVNINWGTYMIADLYKKYGNKDAVLSAYNKGEGGYKRTGKAVSYIKKHNEVLVQIKKSM